MRRVRSSYHYDGRPVPRLTRIRIERGLTCAELARAAGVPACAISLYTAHGISRRYGEAIARALGVTVEEITGLEGG